MIFARARNSMQYELEKGKKRAHNISLPFSFPFPFRQEVWPFVGHCSQRIARQKITGYNSKMVIKILQMNTSKLCFVFFII